MAWEDILAEISPEDTDKPILEKYKSKIETGYLRQSDYSRKQDELRNKVALADQWDEWQKSEWDADRKMTKTAAQKVDEAERLATRVAELEKGAGSEMTWEEIEKGLESRNYVKADALKEVVKKSDYEKDVESRFGGRDAAIEHLFSEVTPLVLDHKEQFGTHLDTKAFLTYIGSDKERFKNPRKAYDDFIATEKDRAAIVKEKAQLDEDKAKFAEEQRKVTEAAATRMPTDTGEGLGTIQRMQRERLKVGEGEVDLSKAKLGDGTLAAEGARLLREGKLAEMATQD